MFAAVAYGFNRCAQDDNAAAAVAVDDNDNDNDNDNGCDGGNEWAIEEQVESNGATEILESKIPMEVNPTDNVGKLKKELQKLQQRLHFHLPPEGFFFIYDHDVMDDDRSFRWHGVAHSDTIEIFNGSASGGS